MCLYTEQIEPYIAKEDIIVYKVLKKVGNKYFTYFQDYPVELNSLLTPEPIKGDVVIEDEPYYYIEGGMIHSYVDSKFSEFNSLKSQFLVKAIIKKGTKFYIGLSEKEIASESLYITDEIINPNNEDKQIDLYKYW